MDRLKSSLPFGIYEHRRSNEDYTKKTVKELLVMLDKVYKPSPSEDVDHDKWVEITAVLAERFDLVRVRDASKTMLYELNELIDKQNELIKAFISHRHDKEKSYSGKPVW